MQSAESERVQLDAAKDLADRGTETSKIQKHQIESWTLGKADAAAMAAALVESARIRQENERLRTHDFIKIDGGYDAKERIEDEAGTALEGIGQGAKAVEGGTEGPTASEG